MPTPTFAHPIPLQDLNLWGAVTGTPTFATTGLRSGGGNVRMICTAAGAVQRVQYSHAAGVRALVETFYYMQTGTPSANTGIYNAVNANGNASISAATSGNGGGLFATAGAGTAGTVSAALTNNQWYRVDVRSVVSGGVLTVDWWLDGVAQSGSSVSQTDADFTSSRLGINAAITLTASFMDHLGSYTSADAPLGQHTSKLYDLATAVGANHSLGAGTFQKTTTTSITSGDANSEAELTEKPFSLSQFVAQTANDAAAYVEYPVADSGESVAPSIVLIGSLFGGAATGVYTTELRAYDGTSEGTDLWTGLTKSGTTSRYSLNLLTSPPSGGSWTDAKFDALRLRFGFSGDANPDPRLGGLAVMAVFKVSVPQTIVLGQATDTSTAQPITRVKTKAIGQATATQTAQPMTHAKVKAIGQATATQTAQPMTRLKAKAFGQATSTQTAQPIAHTKLRTLGQAAETDAAQAMAKAKVKSIGQVAETDTAQVVRPVEAHPIGQATSSEAAQPFTHTKLRLLGQATETDAAQSMTRTKAKAFGQAVETDTAQAVARLKRRTLGQVVETDTAQAMARAKAKAFAQALETDAAQAMTRRKLRLLGQATSTQTANPMTASFGHFIGTATEADNAQPITRTKRKSIGQATSVELAQALAHLKARLLGQVAEIDAAQVLTHAKQKALGLVTSSEAAQPILRVKTRLLGLAASTEAPMGLSHAKLRVLGLATESDAAQILQPVKVVVLGQAQELDLAGVITPIGPRTVFAHDLTNQPWVTTLGSSPRQRALASSPYEERRP